MEAESLFEKAAAIAVFHFDLRRAITTLTKASSKQQDHNLKLVAMALAGFSNHDVKTGLWKSTCLDPAVFGEIKHPYLRACFNFLCNDSKEFNAILNEEGLSLNDKIAFACRFLDESKVIETVFNTYSSVTAICRHCHTNFYRKGFTGRNYFDWIKYSGY